MITRRNLIVGSSTIAAASLLPVTATGAAPIASFRPNGDMDVSHAAYDKLLRAIIKPDNQGYNRVDYRSLKPRLGVLKDYIVMLEGQAPSRFSANAAHAYWINLYNAKTLEIVGARYPVSSIKKINLGGGGLFGSGPWSKKLIAVEGVPLSLDDIEHNIVRAHFRNPMSHYALNCASYSCPNLSRRAFTAKNLVTLMQQNGAAYVNHPRGIAIEGSSLTVSKIFKWYAGDFGGSSNLKKHWSTLASPERRDAINSGRIARYVYDWTLNDI